MLENVRQSAVRLVDQAQPTPALERWALRVFLRLDQGAPAPPAAIDAIHVLNPDEQAAMRRIQRAAIARAALAGALSAALTSAAELLRLGFWGYVAVMLAAAACELSFLFWDGLRAVHALARAAGLPKDDSAISSGMTLALARAALELPNPPENLLGINPLRASSRWRLLLVSFIYKAKIALSNFLLRAILARGVGRVAARSYLVLVSIPVTALWNAVICWMILREARIRAMGPSAAHALLGPLLQNASALGAVEAALRAVACSVVAKRELHPNLVVALDLIHQRAGNAPLEHLDDEGQLWTTMDGLAPADRLWVLDVLKVALILDGRLSPRERRLWILACARAQTPPNFRALRTLRRAFVAGRL